MLTKANPIMFAVFMFAVLALSLACDPAELGEDPRALACEDSGECEDRPAECEPGALECECHPPTRSPCDHPLAVAVTDAGGSCSCELSCDPGEPRCMCENHGDCPTGYECFEGGGYNELGEWSDLAWPTCLRIC